MITSYLSSVKTVTKKMQELLIECHERLLLKQEPISTYYSKFARGLLEKGYIESKSILKNDKPFEGFVITQKGIEYLEQSLQEGKE
ncbi:MAG: hypothetical protein ABIO04_09590 [Ferruginibacter sp.]